jgi:hypothetical protein
MTRARKERTCVFASGLRIECAISSSRFAERPVFDECNRRLHEEFKRRFKTLTVLPSADTAAMLFWALRASGQINIRQVDRWQTTARTTIDQPIDLAA